VAEDERGLRLTDRVQVRPGRPVRGVELDGGHRRMDGTAGLEPRGSTFSGGVPSWKIAVRRRRT